MVWYFIGVYIINRTLHGRAEIRNFPSRVEKIIHSFAQFRHSKRNFLSPRGHVILYFSGFNGAHEASSARVLEFFLSIFVRIVLLF